MSDRIGSNPGSRTSSLGSTPGSGTTGATQGTGGGPTGTHGTNTVANTPPQMQMPQASAMPRGVFLQTSIGPDRLPVMLRQGGPGFSPTRPNHAPDASPRFNMQGGKDRMRDGPDRALPTPQGRSLREVSPMMRGPDGPLPTPQGRSLLAGPPPDPRPLLRTSMHLPQPPVQQPPVQQPPVQPPPVQQPPQQGGWTRTSASQGPGTEAPPQIGNRQGPPPNRNG